MKNALVSQYKASLRMLMSVIEECPDSLWEDDNYENPYWRIVYHTLFYTALYLSKKEDEFIPWSKHIKNYNNLGSLSHDKSPVVINRIYYKADLMDYAATILKNLENAVIEDVNEDSGFYWLPMKKGELQLYNIRHLQHHTGQLIERLHQNGISGINWVGKG